MENKYDKDGKKKTTSSECVCEYKSENKYSSLYLNLYECVCVRALLSSFCKVKLCTYTDCNTFYKYCNAARKMDEKRVNE